MVYTHLGVCMYVYEKVIPLLLGNSLMAALYWRGNHTIRSQTPSYVSVASAYCTHTGNHTGMYWVHSWRFRIVLVQCEMVVSTSMYEYVCFKWGNYNNSLLKITVYNLIGSICIITPVKPAVTRKLWWINYTTCHMFYFDLKHEKWTSKRKFL